MIEEEIEFPEGNPQMGDRWLQENDPDYEPEAPLREQLLRSIPESMSQSLDAVVASQLAAQKARVVPRSSGSFLVTAKDHAVWKEIRRWFEALETVREMTGLPFGRETRVLRRHFRVFGQDVYDANIDVYVRPLVKARVRNAADPVEILEEKETLRETRAAFNAWFFVWTRSTASLPARRP